MDIFETFWDRVQSVTDNMRELSRRSGIPYMTIIGYRNKGRVPTLENVVAIAETLDVSIDWLCGVNDDAPQKIDHDMMRAMELMEVNPVLLKLVIASADAERMLTKNPSQTN